MIVVNFIMSLSVQSLYRSKNINLMFTEINMVKKQLKIEKKSISLLKIVTSKLKISLFIVQVS